MHDRLFANQRALDAESLEAAVVELGLDIDAFKKAIADDKYAEIIARQQSIATTLNAKGTPNFFINGRNLRGARIGTPAFFFNGKLAIQGAYPFETFKAAIDAELE